MIKKPVVSASLILAPLIANADNLIAGYLDTTATASALKINMNQAQEDDYNMVVFGFARIILVQVLIFMALHQLLFLKHSSVPPKPTARNF